MEPTSAGATCRSCLDMLISVTRTIGFILILKFAYLKHYVSSEINSKSTYEQCNYVKFDDLVYFAGETVEMDSAEHAVEMPKRRDYFDYVKDLSCVAAFCSDLPEIETNDVWQAGIRHETDDDKDTDDEYRKDSGRTGCFENFKSTFQMTNAFPSPEIGTMGWQSALLGEQKRQRTKKHVFRPFQQQREATALGISEVATDDEYGSYTSERKYSDLNDGRYKKTIYVKTWTSRTITVVFSPERATRFMREEIERKTGIPKDHQQLVAGGRVLMDNVSMKEIGLSEGRTIEMTAKIMGGMKHKSLSPKPMDTEKRREERIRTVYRREWP